MIEQNKYRTHACSDISEKIIGNPVTVAGWVETVRDHGGIKFMDLRDHWGIVQVVFHDESLLDGVTRESAVSISGIVEKRSEDTVNNKIETGTVEIFASALTVLGKALPNLPFEVLSSTDTKEDLRLHYRFLDLRNPKLHHNIMLRSQIISYLRKRMEQNGFTEIQTPILSTSSPEGARDYLIPSRKHRGKFYALPQAPQIFKQLLMVSGFERYFQIAPCFRDEDARADRSPGEFYQLDFEMAFAEQDDVFKVAEDVLYNTFRTFSDKPVSPAPFVRIPYREAMLSFGTDKPDLRNPLRILDISDLFTETGFKPFLKKTVRAINAGDCTAQSRAFFDNMLKFATDIGMPGLGYIKVAENGSYQGPIDKFLSPEDREALRTRAALKAGDVLFFIADNAKNAPLYAGQIRMELGRRLSLIDEDRFEFCYITDFPMYEIDEENGGYAFTHNPFSMPQGGMDALLTKKPDEILAYQYDIVCNGVELSSGAVRNHDIDVMVKAFEIAGYTEKDVEEKFGALYNAFKYGAPPHAGMAPGIDRMVMLLCGEQNIREVIPFPMNSNAQDLLLGAPTEVTEQQLREVHIRIRQ